MSFQQGLSGLKSSSTALDVTSNNIANSATVGFKSSEAQFADIYAASLSGTGTSQVGIGSTVTSVSQQFTQGNITTTSNSLDISINGNGFFRMDDNGTITYSRAGQFELDANGYIVDDSGRVLTGYLADSTGNIIQSSPVDIQLSSANVAPVATGASGTTDAGVQANFNFNSNSTVPTTDFDTTVDATENATTSYNYSTSTTIYDSLGNSHTLTFYLALSDTVDTSVTGATSTWNVYVSVDGTATDNSGLSATTVSFDSSGNMLGTGILSASIDLDQVMTDQGETNIASSPLAFDIDLSDSTQYGTSFAVNSLAQDGYTSGSLSSVSVGDDGIVTGTYSNGQTRALAQVVLATFANSNGLTSLGDNQWAETAASGSAIVGTPTSGTLGTLQSLSVEESNVDLTAELVDLITEQRNYQANAQTIKTEDAIMNTLVNLR
jgi:flagellar hook protein FlgE